MKVAIINSTNYEAWLLDFVEGRLSSSETGLLRAFAQSHPELNIDLEDLDLFYLESDTEQAFDTKADLKKSELSKEIAEQILFEAVEDETQLEKAEQILSDYPALAIDFKAYKKTKLKPDLSIVFDDKIGLKKSLVLDEATELKVFEATEFPNETLTQITELAKNDLDIERHLKAYQSARLTADQSVVYPNKKELKKALIFGMQQKTLYRVAALLIGISFLGTYIFTDFQNSNTTVAKKIDPQPEQPITIQPVNTSEVTKNLAVIEKKTITKPFKKTMQSKVNIKSLPHKSLQILPSVKPMQEEINLAEQKKIIMEGGITIEPIAAEDPIVLALENKSLNKKANPTIVLEDKEEELLANETETKDPLLYTAANKVNRVLGLITNKKIPVSKKKDKDKVSYAIGKDLLSYSTNKKMQP